MLLPMIEVLFFSSFGNETQAAEIDAMEDNGQTNNSRAFFEGFASPGIVVSLAKKNSAA